MKILRVIWNEFDMLLHWSISFLQSSEQTDGHQDSECDIYESNSDVESQEGGEQRESGDGQEEEKPQKKLDDDEDRRNPQYIPKRGTFYEHDDRTTDEVTDNNTEQQTNVKETKEKKVWKDKEDRWDHDRYNDEEQAPKRPEELIATYGYDIRNEEGPPRARRRRRYGWVYQSFVFLKFCDFVVYILCIFLVVDRTSIRGIGRTKTLMERLHLVEEPVDASKKITKIFLLLVIVR